MKQNKVLNCFLAVFICLSFLLPFAHDVSAANPFTTLLNIVDTYGEGVRITVKADTGINDQYAEVLVEQGVYYRIPNTELISVDVEGEKEEVYPYTFANQPLKLFIIPGGDKPEVCAVPKTFSLGFEAFFLKAIDFEGRPVSGRMYDLCGVKALRPDGTDNVIVAQEFYSAPNSPTGYGDVHGYLHTENGYVFLRPTPRDPDADHLAMELSRKAYHRFGGPEAACVWLRDNWHRYPDRVSGNAVATACGGMNFTTRYGVVKYVQTGRTVVGVAVEGPTVSLGPVRDMSYSPDLRYSFTFDKSNGICSEVYGHGDWLTVTEHPELYSVPTRFQWEGAMEFHDICIAKGLYVFVAPAEMFDQTGDALRLINPEDLGKILTYTVQ